MKNYKVVLVLLLLFHNNIFSQDSAIALSKFERFTSETGKMYKTETIEIGSIKNIHVIISKVTDISTALSAKAIRVVQSTKMLGVSYEYGSLTIDIEESEGVYKALEYYLTVIKTKPKYLPAYYYITTNDVIVSCSTTEGAYGTGWSVSLSQRYHNLKSTISNSIVTLRNKDIDDLVELIKKAKESNL